MPSGVYKRIKKRSWKLSDSSKYNIAKGHFGLKHMVQKQNHGLKNQTNKPVSQSK